MTWAASARAALGRRRGRGCCGLREQSATTASPLLWADSVVVIGGRRHCGSVCCAWRGLRRGQHRHPHASSADRIRRVTIIRRLPRPIQRGRRGSTRASWRRYLALSTTSPVGARQHGRCGRGLIVQAHELRKEGLCVGRPACLPRAADGLPESDPSVGRLVAGHGRHGERDFLYGGKSVVRMCVWGRTVCAYNTCV